MLDATVLRAAGTSPAAIAHHYDLPDEFFRLWLGDDLVYSCGLWDTAVASDSLAAAQSRKLDFFATALNVEDGHLLDIGCGWGGLLHRCVTTHGLAGGVGLTLSRSQADIARRRTVPGVTFHVESWVDHEPDRPYDAISCIEATEHLASDRLDADEKVAVYRSFFERCAGWLRDGGRLGLQLICLDNVGHGGSRAGRGASSELIRVDIFPESMPASLSELVLGWETQFELETFLDHPEHYRRTFRAWGLAYRAAETRARALVGNGTWKTFSQYFSAGEVYFRRREDSLYRVILKKRARPKQWATVVIPSRLGAAPDPSAGSPSGSPPAGASPAAIRSHYDVSNAFYGLWLGPTMMYSSGLWSSPADDPADLAAAETRKIDYFAGQVMHASSSRVLDVGCGWGFNARRVVERHGASLAVGLTLSAAQHEYARERATTGVDIRLEHWRDHRPAHSYDAIVSYGAFEHFARDGTSSIERIHAYREFFARCFHWLAPDGRLGLETIAHDGAPDTAAPLGRGPLGDSVLSIYPESICPHLSELVLGFEPYFEVEALRSDAADFARTCRLWLLALRANEAEAVRLAGADTVRRFQRYLISSEVQFRTNTITNYRVVLHRRPVLRW